MANATTGRAADAKAGTSRGAGETTGRAGRPASRRATRQAASLTVIRTPASAFTSARTIGRTARANPPPSPTRIPNLPAIRFIVVSWLALMMVIRVSFLGSGDAGGALAPVAMVLLSFGVPALFVRYSRRLRGSLAGWLVVIVQAAVTYLPFALFGRQWMPGNSGMLVGTVLLASGRSLLGLPLAAGVAVMDLVLTTTVLHLTQFSMFVYPLTATLDNGVQFWGLVMLTRVVEDLHTERGELARLAAADERSRAERTLRMAFGRRLLLVESHVENALRRLETSPDEARDDVTAAIRVARECQESVRRAAVDPPGTEVALALTPRASTSKMQLIAIAALGLLLFNFSLQAVADAVDDIPASLTVVGFAAVILAAVTALRHGQRTEVERRDLTDAAFVLRVVTIGGTIVFPLALITVVLLMSPPLGAWVGFAALGLTAVTMQTRTRASWRLLLTLVVVSMVLSLTLAPAISEGSFANGVYLFAGAAALAVDTYGMVRLVQLEGALLKTRRQAVTLAALRERTRVARDVHDLLGLGITTIVLKAELAARLLHTDPDRARNHLDEARRLVQNAAEAAGAITGAASDSKGPNASLTTEAHSAECALAAAGIGAELHLVPVSQSTDAVLAVVLREAVNNVLRHSTATRVRVALSTCDDQAFFSVENDGAGQGPTAPGRGLQNITSRVGEAGGRAEVSQGGGRFCLTVTMPV